MKISELAVSILAGKRNCRVPVFFFARAPNEAVRVPSSLKTSPSVSGVTANF